MHAPLPVVIPYFFRQEYQNEFCNIKEGIVNLFGENIVVINNEN